MGFGISPGAQLSAEDLRTGPTPVIDGGEVTFIAAGTPSDPPRIVADFNGWDPAAGAMKRAEVSGFYTLKTRLDPAARIEYLIAYRDRFEVDPRNPLRVPAPTGAPRSELRMPAYRPPAALPRAAVPGVVQNFPFTSRAGETRRVRVHRPRSASGPLPVLYIHDGIIAADALDMPAMIDALVESGQMAPVIAVFINSIDRYDDYAAGSMFSYVFTGELVPAIEQRYAALPGARAVLGFSRSAVGALDVALNGAVPFARCGLVAPAVNAQTLTSVMSGEKLQEPRVTILAGTYDIPLIDDAKAVRAALNRRGVPLEWLEIPEGHNHEAWRRQLPRLLTSWFPPAAATTSAAQAPPEGMATYQVAFLKRGTTPGSAETQKAHLAHLGRLEKEGVLVGAGPVAAKSDLRGILILKAPSLERARELVAADPSVKAGGLVAEVLPWWGPDNIGEGYFATLKANPAAQPKMVTYQLGLLRSGPKRDQPKEEAAKIQAGHRANIAAMARAGKLIAAGPFLADGELRGIFLFDATADEAKALTAADPAVQAGRLVLELYPWLVAEGVFTPRAAQ